MSVDKEVIRACLEARDQIESILLQHHDDNMVTDIPSRDVANQVLVQFIILTKITRKCSFSSLISSLGQLHAPSQLPRDFPKNDVNSNFSGSQFIARLSLMLRGASNPNIPKLVSLSRLSNHPLIVMEPKTIQLIQALPSKAVFSNQNKTSNDQDHEPTLEEVFNSLSTMRTSINSEIIGTLGEQLLVTDERKKKGIFYTPSPLTRYMVQRAIETWVFNRLRQECGVKINNNVSLESLLPKLTSEQLIFLTNELLNMKVLDPAVGSGNFLAACFRQILSIIEEIKKTLQKSQLDSKSLKLKTPCCEVNSENEIPRHVMFHVLHGIDVNPLAVKLARIRLLLMWLETRDLMDSSNYHERDLLSNLKVGNALLGFVKRPDSKKSRKYHGPMQEKDELVTDYWKKSYWDSLYSKSLHSDLENEHLYGERKELLFHWFMEFPKIFHSRNDNAGFDLIICNPPYLSLKSSKTPKMLINPALLRHVFGKVQDLYECFIKRADELLNSSGVACFIVPNNIILYIPRDLESRLVALDNIGERIFPNAPTTPVAIMIWSKKADTEQVAFKNLIKIKDKMTKLSMTLPTLIPHLWWLREHPIVQILKKNDITLETLGIKVTRGEEIGKKALIKKKHANLKAHIPIFAASNMRFYGLNPATHYIDPTLITKKFYDQPKLGLSISFRNRIKCSFLGLNTTLKSIICLHTLPRKWMWWLLIFYNSSIFDFYHRCTISWYQEKRTNTIAEIRNFPIFLPKQNTTGLQNLARFLTICHEPYLHRLLDLSLIEIILPDMIPQVEENDHILTTWLNHMGRDFFVPTDLIKFYPPNPNLPHHQQLLQEMKDSLTQLTSKLLPSKYPIEVKNQVKILNNAEKLILQSNWRTRM